MKNKKNKELLKSKRFRSAFFLQSVLDASIDGIITINEKGKIEMFSRGAERIFQYTEDEVFGENIEMLIVGDTKDFGKGVEVEGRRKDGTLFPMELSMSEIEVEGEQKFTGIIREISERKESELEIIKQKEEVESAMRRLEAVLSTAVDAIITINNRGTIESFNNAAQKLFQYTEEEVVGQNIKMLMPEDYASKHDGYLHNYRETHEAKIIGKGREVVAKRKNGTTFPMDLSVSEMKVDGEQKFTGIIRDISERKESEEAVALYLQKLKKSNEELDSFAYIASHDLKSPLRAINNLAQWIKEDAEEVLPDESKKNLILMQKRVVRMEGLLDDLLAYSSIGRVKSDVSEVDIKVLIERITSLLDIPDGFLVKSEGEFPVFSTEQVPLELVLRNLISNAIKHRDVTQEGHVIASVSKQDDVYEFKVSDNGPGIDKKYHEKIFEMFRTLKSRDEVEGSGMGLAAVKKAIESHGGEIWLESAKGEGASFYFTWKSEQ